MSRPLLCPTAQTSCGPAAATPNRQSPVAPGFGLGTTAQRLPSQCSTSVRKVPVLACCSPTAHASRGETAAAENRMSRRLPSPGDLTMCQAVPVQASIRLCAKYDRSRATPTAHAWWLVAATPNSVLKFGPEFGTGVCTHRVPSKWAAVASVASMLLPLASGRKLPTAHTLCPEAADTAPRLLSLVPSAGARWTVHPPPLEVSVVYRTGSFGVGESAAMLGTGSGVNRNAAEPVTANSGVSGLTVAVSQVCCRQGRPKLRWIVCSSE